MTKPDPTPEGALIRDALRARTDLSTRKAAPEAGISEGRWRQIVAGYATPAAGTHVPVVGPAETVAAMARVALVTPEELSAVGREDAADALRSMPSPAGPASAGWEGELRAPESPLTDHEILLWRVTEKGRWYRLELAHEGISVEYTFGAHEGPEEVIEDLRDLLEPHKTNVRRLEHRRARR